MKTVGKSDTLVLSDTHLYSDTAIFNLLKLITIMHVAFDLYKFQEGCCKSL